MERLLDWLARHARPTLIWVPVLLATGALVTVMGLPLIGWTIYGVGHVGLLVGFAALVAVHRASFDWFAWVAFGVLSAGLLVGLPVLLIVWGHYAANPGLREMIMPAVVTPLGAIYAVVTWIGLALVGWAGYLVRALPTAGAVAFIIAAVLALPAEIGWFAPVAWLVGILIAASALVWVAPLPAVSTASRQTP